MAVPSLCLPIRRLCCGCPAEPACRYRAVFHLHLGGAGEARFQGAYGQHATRFDNAALAAITEQPAPWRNEVMTCYLKSAVSESLSEEIWIYGESAMSVGYTFVIALQQIDASAVLANMAYVLPQ